MYYAMTLSQSATNSPALQHVFFEAFTAADGFRTAIMEKAGFQWSEEKNTYWKQINTDYYQHPDSPIHANLTEYNTVWHVSEWDPEGHWDWNYNYEYYYHTNDNVATNLRDAIGI